MQSGFVQVPGGARLLGFGGLEVRSADCLGVSDGLGAWSFSFLISTKRTSFFALSAMFVVPIFNSVSIIDTMDEYSFSISVSNPACRGISAAFADISVSVVTRPHTMSKASWYLLQYLCMSLQSDSRSFMVSIMSREMFIGEMCWNFVCKISHISLVSLPSMAAWCCEVTEFLMMPSALLRAGRCSRISVEKAVQSAWGMISLGAKPMAMTSSLTDSFVGSGLPVTAQAQFSFLSSPKM